MKFNARHEAEIRVEAMLDQVEKLGRLPDLIPLSDYADEETFKFLLPKPGWAFEEWHAVNTEVASLLRDEGFNVQLVRLEMGEYIDWLARYKLNNTPQNRAQYVSWLIAPDNAKPNPILD